MKAWKTLVALSIGVSAIIGTSMNSTAQAETTLRYTNVKVDTSLRYANTHTNLVRYPSIKVEVNGKNYQGIVVNGKTYVLWGALNLMGTPYVYKGKGLFSIVGENIQGTIYNNQTYLPWDTIGSTPVKANHIDGGWNFTRIWQDPATDGYKLQVFYNKLQALPWEMPPFYIATFKDNGTEIHGLVNWNDTTDTPGYASGGGVTNQETPTYFPIWQEDPGHVTRTITWTDPKGEVHTMVIHMTIGYPESTNTPIPSDDKLVTTIPIQVNFDQVMFYGTVERKKIHWQLDTGAMTPVLNGQDAKDLNLPKLQEITIEGVTGKDTAYLSKMNVEIGGVEFKDVTCIVYPNMQNNSLFGYSFFADNKYDLLVSYKHNTISILK